MVISISRREVLNNLIRFKDNLLEMHAKEKQGGGSKGRSYKVLLNRKTGDMRFAQKISSLEQHFPRKAKGAPEDWKEVRIVVEQKSRGSPVHFEVRDVHDETLKSSDVDPLAWRIAKETLDVLNLKGKEVHAVPVEMLPEEAVLRDLSSIHLAPQGESIEDLPGWAGALSRLEAEKKLSGKAIGTYLIREGDSLDYTLSRQLSVANLLDSYPYVLTVVEKDDKISECLFLQTEKGWLLYSDEPILGRYIFYSTPQALLQTLSGIARHPLR
jgi:hypothetical protein